MRNPDRRKAIPGGCGQNIVFCALRFTHSDQPSLDAPASQHALSFVRSVYTANSADCLTLTDRPE